MPRRSKRARQLEKARHAREAKRRKALGGLVDQETQTESNLEGREDKLIAEHVQNWIKTLPRDGVQSLSLCLHQVLVTKLGMQLTPAAGVIGEVIGRSDRTVREWRFQFIENGGSFPDSELGHYQRKGVLWYNEDLNEEARRYIRSHAVTGGTSMMTTTSFCSWVNESLLPRSSLEPDYPKSISLRLQGSGYTSWASSVNKSL